MRIEEIKAIHESDCPDDVFYFAWLEDKEQKLLAQVTNFIAVADAAKAYVENPSDATLARQKQAIEFLEK